MSKVENVFMSNLDSVFCTVPDVSTVVANFVREGERGSLLRPSFPDDILAHLVFNLRNVVKFMLHAFLAYYLGGICKSSSCCNGFCNDLTAWSCFLLSF